MLAQHVCAKIGCLELAPPRLRIANRLSNSRAPYSLARARAWKKISAQSYFVSSCWSKRNYPQHYSLPSWMFPHTSIGTSSSAVWQQDRTGRRFGSGAYDAKKTNQHSKGQVFSMTNLNPIPYSVMSERCLNVLRSRAAVRRQQKGQEMSYSSASASYSPMPSSSLASSPPGNALSLSYPFNNAYWKQFRRSPRLPSLFCQAMLSALERSWALIALKCKAGLANTPCKHTLLCTHTHTHRRAQPFRLLAPGKHMVYYSLLDLCPHIHSFRKLNTKHVNLSPLLFSHLKRSVQTRRPQRFSNVTRSVR